MIRDIGRVTIELSNRCQMAREHVKCPLHAHSGPSSHLPMSVVRKVLNELGEEFSGRMAFHNYSEPLVDPRLFLALGEALKRCPRARVFIMTNCWALDQTILDELAEYNVVQVEATGYSAAEIERIGALRIPANIEFKIARRPGLDDRLKQYDSEPTPPGRPEFNTCDAPLGEIIIRHTGVVGLCCFDWANSVTFGNVAHEKLDRIIAKPEFVETHEALLRGERLHPVCQRCGVGRAEKGK